MAHLLDTSVLVRLASPRDPQHSDAMQAVVKLHRHGDLLHITPQALIEFRNVATRPKTVNGLGLSITEAETKATAFEQAYPLLPDTPDIFLAWKAIVAALGVIGKQVHDARLVAVCHAHGVSHLLTFNVAHFARLTTFGPTVTIVDPKTV